MAGKPGRVTLGTTDSGSAVLAAAASTLVTIDVQAKLVPALAGGADMVANARRLVEGASILGVPATFTEQYAKGLGPTLPDLQARAADIVHKMSFDACVPDLLDRIEEDRVVVLCGCEAHVCVLQTALGLLARGHRVAVVRDAVASRRTENRDAALDRLSREGAEIVTTEMVLFEWLGTAEHPRFRDVMALIR